MGSPAAAIRVSLCNVLLATDFSASAEMTAAHAVRLCRRYGATLYTLTVVPQEITDYVQPPDPFHLRHVAGKKMTDFAASERLQGVRHRELVKEGFVVDEILGAIRNLDIDLLVIGARGRGGIRKLVRGSLAEQIAGSVPCPVLTVGPQAWLESGPPAGLREIVCATNLAYGSERALAWAVWMAEQEHARLTLLHVLSAPGGARPASPESEREPAARRLAELLKDTASPALQTELIVDTGAIAECILKAAATRDAELIVMGARSHTHAGISAHLPGHVFYHVLSHARCPVLTVRD